jgi:hypothetical protein
VRAVAAAIVAHASRCMSTLSPLERRLPCRLSAGPTPAASGAALGAAGVFDLAGRGLSRAINACCIPRTGIIASFRAAVGSYAIMGDFPKPFPTEYTRRNSVLSQRPPSPGKAPQRAPEAPLAVVSAFFSSLLNPGCPRRVGSRHSSLLAIPVHGPNRAAPV